MVCACLSVCVCVCHCVCVGRCGESFITIYSFGLRCLPKRSVRTTPDWLTLQEYQLGIVKPGAKASEGCLELTAACPTVSLHHNHHKEQSICEQWHLDISHIRG